jgi:hypothetical protein
MRSTFMLDEPLVLGPRLGIRRRARHTFLAKQHLVERRYPPFGRNDPRPINPRGIMADVLVVTALELRHPITPVV